MTASTIQALLLLLNSSIPEPYGWATEDVAAFDQCKRLLKRLAPVAATRVPPAATARNSRPINPGGSFMSTYVAPLSAGAPRLSPLDLEIKDFTTFL